MLLENLTPYGIRPGPKSKAAASHLCIQGWLLTSAYVQCMSLAGRCRVRGGSGCKHDTVDLWLLTILQDLVLASYSCVIAS